jgi:hypothetical protein
MRRRRRLLELLAWALVVGIFAALGSFCRWIDALTQIVFTSPGETP